MPSFQQLACVAVLAAAVHSLPHAGTFSSRDSLRKRQSRTSAPDGCLTVGSDGTYSTVSDAVSALGTGSDVACIFISSGTYEEQVTIDYAGSLTIYGETSDSSSYSSNEVTITHTITSTDAGTLDKSSTVNIVSDNVSLYNINVVNGYGKGSQAVALTANADQLVFYGCSFSGYQDTLYAKAGTQYYSNCMIEGTGIAPICGRCANLSI